jgi:AcrR family transcriptional regulator
MAGSRKTRRYESPQRRAQAAATRAQILDAAGRLFVQQGFTATSMASIAAEAGVALKTVYVAFETKSGVLRSLWNLRLRGDVEERAVQDRAWYLEVLAEHDPRRRLLLNARNSREVKERVDGLFAVIRDAAPTDVDIRELWGRIQRDFHENQAAIVRGLDDVGALRAGLDVGRATDVLWTLNHPDVWLLLVGERRWTPVAYERWLGETTCAELLGPGV